MSAFRQRFARAPLVFFLFAAAASPGVLVTRSAKGIQFSEAISISINGKDKALDAGPEAPAPGPVGKLPSVKLESRSLFLDKDKSALVLFADSNLSYLFPEGLPKKEPTTIKAAWSSANISYKHSKSDKQQGQVAIADFVAFLSGDVPELVSLCTNEQLLTLVGGSGNAFATEMELLPAVVKSYSTDPAIAPLQHGVERAMLSRFERFESGTATRDVLEQALKLADLSAAAYPNVPAQAKLRDEIRRTNDLINRRVAILRAFAAGSEWDQYLLADKEIARYEAALPEISKIRVKALNASLQAHRRNGEEFFKEREYEAALREFRMASRRQPSDELLVQNVRMTWANYSREVAQDNESNRKRLGSGEQEVLNEKIQFASNYLSENKLDFALKSIQEAEKTDPNSLQMLLKKAEILGRQRSFTEAFAALDRYDLHAIDEEREKSSTLRNELLFRQKSSVEDIKEQLRKAWTDGSYQKLYHLALEGLQAKDDDGELLYEAAIASLITRDPQRASTFLARYLEVTNTLDADTAQRARARSVLANITVRKAEDAGAPNWLSGNRLPGNVYYCPISLAFQPKIDHIDASGKMHVQYEWNGNKLVSIKPTFEKAARATGEKSIGFVYEDSVPQVFIASDTSTRLVNPVPSDPDERVKQASVILLNNPDINPDAAEKLTGNTVALGISGNRYFEPFVWDKVHYFRLKYDYAGRVAEAKELVDRGGPPTSLTVEFEWSGRQLMAIHGYEGPDKHRNLVYTRTLQYDGSRLVSEQVEAGGKSSRIKYNYNGDRLVGANASPDPTLDGRSRTITFE